MEYQWHQWPAHEPTALAGGSGAGCGLLQELKCTDKDFPARALLDFGYHAIWHGQQSWNGVAILSRHEIKETRRGLDGDPNDTHGRYIEAFINGMVIGCLYLPNGNPYPGLKFDYKIRWIMRLTSMR